MGDTLCISREALEAIRAHAASASGEVCGLLCSRGGGSPACAKSRQTTHALPCDNVASNLATNFEIDPAALIAAHRSARDGGPTIVGYYHSHPSGVASPSVTDAAQAAPDGMIWLIVASDEIAAFRAVPDGAVHGRFDPVMLLVAD